MRLCCLKVFHCLIIDIVELCSCRLIDCINEIEKKTNAVQLNDFVRTWYNMNALWMVHDICVMCTHVARVGCL